MYSYILMHSPKNAFLGECSTTFTLNSTYSIISWEIFKSDENGEVLNSEYNSIPLFVKVNLDLFKSLKEQSQLKISELAFSSLSIP